MAVYEYKAIGANGKPTKGVIDADTPAAARRRLREQDLYPTELAESFAKGASRQGEGIGSQRVSLRDISLLTRQFAVLLHAGMPLSEALTALLDQTSSARLHKALYDIRGKVTEGSTLAKALSGHPRMFNELYINMVGAGETSGALESVLFRLSDILEHQLDLRKRITAALIYPILMTLFGATMVSFLMYFVVPKITAIFDKNDADLPWITDVVIGTSHFLKDYWWVILIAIGCLVGLWRAWLAQPSGRKVWDAFKLKLPGYRTLYIRLISARFARTLGTMLESGLTMMVALDVVRSVLGNRVVEEAIDEVKRGVRRGRDLAVPLKESGIFPPMMLHMIQLGQRSGELENMLIKVAETYDNEVEMSIDALVSIFEPLIIVVMGCFVAVLVFAILLPIFKMSTGFG